MVFLEISKDTGLDIPDQTHDLHPLSYYHTLPMPDRANPGSPASQVTRGTHGVEETLCCERYQRTEYLAHCNNTPAIVFGTLNEAAWDQHKAQTVSCHQTR